MFTKTGLGFLFSAVTSIVQNLYATYDSAVFKNVISENTVSEQLSTITNTQNFLKNLNGMFFYKDGQLVEIPFWGYLIESRKWKSNKVSLESTNNGEHLVWYGKVIDTNMKKLYKSIIVSSYKSGVKFEIIPVKHKYPRAYNNNKKSLCSTIRFKWKITNIPQQ